MVPKCKRAYHPSNYRTLYAINASLQPRAPACGVGYRNSFAIGRDDLTPTKLGISTVTKDWVYNCDFFAAKNWEEPPVSLPSGNLACFMENRHIYIIRKSPTPMGKLYQSCVGLPKGVLLGGGSSSIITIGIVSQLTEVHSYHGYTGE